MVCRAEVVIFGDNQFFSFPPLHSTPVQMMITMMTMVMITMMMMKMFMRMMMKTMMMMIIIYPRTNSSPSHPWLKNMKKRNMKLVMITVMMLVMMTTMMLVMMTKMMML